MTTIPKIFLLFASFLPAIVMAQTMDQKGSLFVDVTIPTNERNISFNRTMEGLFHGGIGYQHNVYNGFTIGVGVNYSYFVMNRVEFSSTIGEGGTHLPTGYLKLGYEKFTTDRVSLYAGLKAGYSNVMIFSDSCSIKLDGPFQQGAVYLSPQVEINVLTEINSPSAFSMILGYSWFFHEYTPSSICWSTFPGYLEEHSQGYLRFLNFGFGYKHYFGKN